MSLKARNLKYLGGLVAMNGALATGLLAQPGIQAGVAALGAGATLVVSAALLASWLIPADVKAILVFWRTKHVLPGHRAFSELAPRDERIDLKALRTRLGAIPREPGAQNKLWYSLLKKHESNAGVAETHQRFLLFRDACAVSIVLSMGSVLMTLVTGAIFWVMAAVLLAQYFIFVVAARNAGKRLVQNVLAVEAASVDA